MRHAEDELGLKKTCKARASKLQPNPAHHLLLYIKLYWKTVTVIHV